MNFMEQANRKKTSSEVKNGWDAKTYKRYQISLRKDEDAEIIEFVESVKDCILPSEIFRIGAEQIKKGFLSQSVEYKKKASETRSFRRLWSC